MASNGTVLPADTSQRRRMLVATTLRICATTAGLLLLYVLVPVPGTSGAQALLGMVAGLTVFLVLVGWQIRTIVRADHPVLRAVEAVAVALPVLIGAFSFTYLSLSRADATSFSEQLERVDALYFTVTMISTVGFGDIVASSDAARILVTVQMLVDIALLAGLARLVVLATRTGLHRQSLSREPRGDGHR
jgi:voltage-gated potassium channel